jgi:predicted nucleic acid-binding protein
LPKNAHRTGRDGVVPRRLFVDSGAWIALVSVRDQHHADADAMFREVVARRIPLLTTNLVFAEVHRFLLFRAGARAAARALDRFESSDRLTLECATAAHHRTARAWLDRLADQPISYTDAVSFAVMSASHCTTTISFDHDFVLAGFSVWRPPAS